MVEELRNEPVEFQKFGEILKQFVNGKLVLTEVQRLTGNLAQVSTDPNTWISRTRRQDDGYFRITVGEQPIPSATLRLWKWGAKSTEAQFIVKTAHEYAHVIQNTFDQYLLDWLDGKIDKVPSWTESYIRLYAALSETGVLSGLAQENIYHMQNQTTGNLKMPTYEDMAELIGASILTKEYFLFRMKHASSHLPPDVVESMWTLISDVVEQFKLQLAQN